ncbi:hypothetical protein AB0J55_17305 [Amycolatopsis sp. NPDC049688]|uniref:hypothetical protein n=1 Tax=Amycolatopsis sp. NPDC049688 TaxID=3154733 RepID=UPI00343E37E2
MKWLDEEEAEYVEYLELERRGYAWVLEHHGAWSREEALAEAREFYRYEPPGNRYRTLVFHDTSWHWAMLRIHGSLYWQAHPELATESAEYEAFIRSST